MPFFLFLLTVISRLPFTSKYLYHMDSGHFALALQDYDLVLHQPHPPGYFLYVMLGKLLYPFISDANTTFVLISILFSGLTVATIYLLGIEMFDARVGTIAAFLALTSPNFWFHGGVALTYCIEAFFSAVIGLLCWRIYQGKSKHLWLSISILALAGGFRQNSVLFLFPLWLFSIRKESLQRNFAGLALGGIVVLAWLTPMVMMTGGTEKYLSAFEELWSFNTGHNSVFEKGFLQLFYFWRILHSFLFYTLGAALPLLVLAFYALVRNGKSAVLKGPKAVFLTFWILPSILFYLLVFIHPANPGYVLVLLPPLALICSVALKFLGCELQRLTGKNYHLALVLVVLLTNTGIFLLSSLPVSREEVKTHDRNISALIKELSTFNPKTTDLFIGPYSFYSYRHLMLYLPAFTVYQVDVRTNETGESRKQFGGANRKTFLTEKIRPSKAIKLFATIFVDTPTDSPEIPHQLSVLRASSGLIIVSGPIDRICDLYPQLQPLWDSGQSTPARHLQMSNHGIIDPTSKTDDGEEKK